METHRALLAAVRKHGNFDDADLWAIHRKGVESGWPGFSDPIETWSFYHKHHDLVWTLLREYAVMEGTTPLKLMAAFEGADQIDDGPKLKKALAQFALSEAVKFFATEESDAATA